jgi:hypothetical protein
MARVCAVESANALFAVELDRRGAAHGVRAFRCTRVPS